MHSLSKLKTAFGASTYFRDRDDYYLSDHSPSEWWGIGAREIGLIGEVGAGTFRDVLEGKINGAQEYPAGEREVKTKGGKTRKVPAHGPGWDNTFSASKSVSIAALLRGDSRIIAAHDAAVREAMRYLESEVAVTRQRVGKGEYEYRHGTGIVAAMFRHASSRSLDPQLHTHVVVANVMRDPVTGKWVSIDSREGLYKLHREAETLYTNALAAALRDLGYKVEWRVNDAGFPEIELPEISQAEIELFSTRKHEIDAKLAAGGITREQATQRERQMATLETRSPKRAVPAAELHRQWVTRLADLGAEIHAFVRPEAGPRPHPDAAADEAVARAAASVSERQARFTLRDLLNESRIFSQGRASETELRDAVRRVAECGDLIATDTLARVPGGDLQPVPGFTTKAGQETERAMLATVERLHGGGEQIMSSTDAKAAVDAANAASGGRLTEEHQRASRMILSGESRIEIVQGLAGSAKTTGVLAVVADEARKRGWTVEAMTPTTGSAQTLGDSIGAKSRTVAAVNLSPTKCAPHSLWIVDEAGLVGASDMQKLLAKADAADAKIVLVGDTRQIGSVRAGRALDQIEHADPQHTHQVTKIVRQKNETLRRAVEAAARGDVDQTFTGVEVVEHHPKGADEDARGNARAAAIDDVAARYIRDTADGADTLVVAFAVADRDAINAAIQRDRVAAGQVQDVRETEVLRAKDWTSEQQTDAARYQVGDVVLARKNVAHIGRGETAVVVAVADGKVTVRNRGGVVVWAFDPTQYKSFTAYSTDSINIGLGDRIVFRGTIAAKDEAGERRAFKNGDTAMIAGRGNNGAMVVTDRKGKRYALDKAGALQADLGYASTADSAQSKTVDRVIGYVRAGSTRLATLQRLYVLVSRAKYHATIITDDVKTLAERFRRNSGEKETALNWAADRARGDSRQPAGPAGPDKDHQHSGGTAETRDDRDPAQPRPLGFLRDVAHAAVEAARPVAAAQALRLRDSIHRAFHQPEPTHITREQAAVAARLALQERDANHDRLLRRRPPSRDDWRRMTAQHGVAVGPDGTRFTQDDNGRVYCDRQLRAERREIARSEWIDHRPRTQYRIVGDPGSTHVIVSHNHGKSWKRADLFDSLATRYRTWRRDRIQAKLELDRLRWQAAGGKETHDSERLARAAIASFRRREKALFKGRLDWDELAAENGVAYDKHGHRYMMDNRGRVWSEALAKRGFFVDRTRAGREAVQDMRQHAKRRNELAHDRASDGTRKHHLLRRGAHAVGYRMARARLERVIGDGQQRELDRLAGLALDESDRRWNDAGRHESRDTRELAREALAQQGKGKFDWDAAALERGALHDREGRRYAIDEKGFARSEALEKTAYHFRYNREAREAKARQDRGHSRGPLGWWGEQRTRQAVWGSIDTERERLGRLAGVQGNERVRQPASTPAPSRGADHQRDAARGR